MDRRCWLQHERSKRNNGVEARAAAEITVYAAASLTDVLQGVPIADGPLWNGFHNCPSAIGTPKLGEKPTNSLIDDAYSSIVLGSSLEVARRFKVLLLNFDDGIATGGTGLAD
jgi:hypothetical protein